MAVYLEYGAARRPARRPRGLSAANGRLLQAVAEDMEDPALRASLHRLSRRGQT